MKPNWNVPAIAIIAGVISIIWTGCASQPNHPQSLHASGMPKCGAKKVNEPPRQLVVSLTDGTRVIGETTLMSLSLQSAVLGKIVIPLEKIRTVKFCNNHESATVSLQNGDKVQGSISALSLTLGTLFGQVTVPLEKTTEIEIRMGDSRLVEWDILPFPKDSDWPGPRGEPAIIKNNDILLQGRPVRSQTTYSLPLSIECEVELADCVANDGGLWLYVLNEQDPRDFNPKRFVMLNFGYDQLSSKFRTGTLAVFRSDGDDHGPMVWGKTPFSMEVGKSYKLRWDIRSNGMKMTIDDQTFDIPGVTVPWEKVQVCLMSWKPANRWHVRNFTVR